MENGKKINFFICQKNKIKTMCRVKKGPILYSYIEGVRQTYMKIYMKPREKRKPL